MADVGHAISSKKRFTDNCVALWLNSIGSRFEVSIFARFEIPDCTRL